MPASIWERLEEHFRKIGESEGKTDVDLAKLRERLEARARALRAAAPREEPGERFAVLAFRIADEGYALRMQEVEGVHALTNFTPVPGAPPYLRGVAHLGGRILSLLELGPLLGVERRGLADLRRALVIGAPPRQTAVLAGEVEDILPVRAQEVSPPSRRRGAPAEECIEGVIGGRRLLLSALKMLEFLEGKGKRP
jgi:purine-binding chemotaxis protein CheW